MSESLKHTLAGILTGLIGTFTSIMTFQVPMALLNPQQSKTWLWVTVGCNLAAIVLRGWVGVLIQGSATANQIGQIAVASMNTGTPPSPSAVIPPTTPEAK